MRQHHERPHGNICVPSQAVPGETLRWWDCVPALPFPIKLRNDFKAGAGIKQSNKGISHTPSQHQLQLFILLSSAMAQTRHIDKDVTPHFSPDQSKSAETETRWQIAHELRRSTKTRYYDLNNCTCLRDPQTRTTLRPNSQRTMHRFVWDYNLWTCSLQRLEAFVM